MGLLIKKKFLALLFLIAFSYGNIGTAAANNQPGDPAPAFSLADLSGQQTQVDWSSKLTVLTFGALWCPTCRNEMPELDEFAAANSDRLMFYMVDIREPAEKVKRYLNEKKLNVPMLLDETGGVSRQYGIKTIPTTVMVDSRGRIVYRKDGEVTRTELEQAATKHLRRQDANE